MSSVEVRPFRRTDRDQLTSLVNAHVQAVVPGVSVLVNTVLSQLEREPGEVIVDPWVVERATLVAVQRERVVAAAHLLRYGASDEVGETYRDAGEIRWLVCWPEASYRPDAARAGGVLAEACTAQLERWGASRQYADGTLPAPGVYGVPEQWPHVQAIYARAGFVHDGHTEVVMLAEVDHLPCGSDAPLAGLTSRRTLGVNGVRISACLGNEVLGYIELDTDLADGGRLGQLSGWADVGNLHVIESHRRRGIATWLVGQAADWLRLARVERLLDYAWSDQADYFALSHRLGFRELTRTARGWTRQ
jgi:GNAT superfamily N-acetyltransferase